MLELIGPANGGAERALANPETAMPPPLRPPAPTEAGLSTRACRWLLAGLIVAQRHGVGLPLDPLAAGALGFPDWRRLRRELMAIAIACPEAGLPALVAEAESVLRD